MEKRLKFISIDKALSGKLGPVPLEGLLNLYHLENVQTFKDVTLKVRMYLETGAVAPYCKHHYLLQLHLAKPRQAEAWVQVGYLCNLHV